MITIESREYHLIADDHTLERGQVFSIRIPDKDVKGLDFDSNEMELINRANNGDNSPALMLRILLMMVEHVDRRRGLLKEGSNG
jgi:hypothetical protein